MCRVNTGRRGVDLDGTLTALGLAVEAVPEVVVRFNLGQPVEFRDDHGVRTRIWHDPKARRIRIEQPDAPPPVATPVLPPFLCTNCTAVLMPWREGQREQTCPLGGHIVVSG